MGTDLANGQQILSAGSWDIEVQMTGHQESTGRIPRAITALFYLILLVMGAVLPSRNALTVIYPPLTAVMSRMCFFIALQTMVRYRTKYH